MKIRKATLKDLQGSLKLDFARKLLEKHKLRYWDIRVESINNTGINAWNNELRQISQSSTEGFCVRVLYGNGWGFAASTDFKKTAETIQKAIKVAKIMDREAVARTGLATLKPIKARRAPRLKEDPRDVSLKEKRDLVLNLAKKAYKYSKKIKSAIVGYIETASNKTFLSQDSFIEQELIYLHLGANITASSQGKFEEQSYRKGDLTGYSIIKGVEEDILKRCEKTLLFLNAKKAKPGLFPIVTDGALTDVFIHEALGHAAEADHVLQEATCLAGLIGKKVAPGYVSVIDNPTANNFTDFGSYYFDDEGTPAQKTYIIKNGVLKTFLHNRETAYKLKAKPTGNARAQSFADEPIIRMSNTYIEKGNSSFEDMLAKIKQGYLLKGLKGGQVNPAKGSFQFAAREAYFVKNGKIVNPAKAVSIVGNTLELLKNIKEIGSIYEEGSPGFCGKWSQRAYVNGRNPAVLIEKALLS